MATFTGCTVEVTCPCGERIVLTVPAAPLRTEHGNLLVHLPNIADVGIPDEHMAHIEIVSGDS